MRARKPGLQAPSNLAGSKIKNTHVFFPHEFFLRDMISKIGKSTCHVSCIYSEVKAIKPTLYLKFSAKYAFCQASRNLKNRLAGSGRDYRIGDLGETRNRSSGCTPAQAGVGRYVGSTGYDTKPSINDDQVDVVVGQAHTTSSLA